MGRTALSVALVTGLSMIATSAQAGVSGHCTYEGIKHALVDGAAWVLPIDSDEDFDWDDDGVPDETVGPDIELGFTTFKIDVGAVQRAEDRDDALMDQAFRADDASKLELTISPDKVITQQYLWISPGTNLSYSSNEVGEFKPKAIGGGKVAGTYKYTDDDAEGPHCELTFDIPLIGDVKDAPPPPPPPGKPLPADGGEPGRLYLALNKAMLAGDLAALEKLMPPAQVAEMNRMRDTPEFAAQLELMQAMTPHDVRIKGGRIDGDTAWIEFDATEGDLPRSGTATLVREEGRWRMTEESTRDRDK
jgi:hypothetical protein